MTSVLLRNGYVIAVEADGRVLPSGYVHVVGERIAAVGSLDQLAQAVVTEADEVIDPGGKRAVPGLQPARPLQPGVARHRMSVQHVTDESYHPPGKGRAHVN